MTFDHRRLAWLVPFLLLACGGSPELAVPRTPAATYSELRPLAIETIGPSHLVVVGHAVRLDGLPEGVILRSEDGGQTFRRQADEVHDLLRVGFQSVSATDRLRVWAGGTRTTDTGSSRAIVFITSDGGNHWRESALPQDPALSALEVQRLTHSNDIAAEAVVRSLDLATQTEVSSTFVTEDGGRSWSAGTFRDPASDPNVDRTASFIDADRGFRLAETAHPGHTFLEVTASGGRDWMPIAELLVTMMDTY